MIDELFFRSLGIIVIAAAVMVMLGRLVRMPAIVVYLMAGVLIGPVLGWVRMDATLELISEAGIALLLFLVGLEIQFDKIRSVGKVALVAGVGQVLFTGIGGFLLCKLLGFSNVEAAFIGSGITFSSTVIAVKLLDEKKELDSVYAHIAVACSLVQSFLVILLLSIISGLAGTGGGSVGEIALGLGKTFGGLVAMIVLVGAAFRFLLAKPFQWAGRSSDTLLIWSLSWCFLLILLARQLGLSLEIGAFLAGLSLAQLPQNADLHRRVHPLMNLFMAIFFVSLGIQMEVGAGGAGWIPAMTLSVFVIVGNSLIYLILIPRFGFSAGTALLTGITGAQISEFSFILAAMGVSQGMLGGEMLSLTAVVGLITMGVSAYLIRYNHQIHGFFRRRGWLSLFDGSRTAEETPPAGNGLHGHVIVVGMNTLGRRLATELAARGETVLAIDTDPAKLESLPVRTLLGSVDYLSVLDEAALPKAKLLVSALRIEDTNDLLAYRCKVAGVPCAIHVIDLSLVDSLLDLDASYLMIPKVDGVKAQTKKLREMGLLQS